MKKHVLLILCLGSVLGLNIYFRLFPAYFPQFKAQAKETIEDRVYQEISKDIDKKFSDFATLARDKLIGRAVAEYNKNNKKTIKSQINGEYSKLKDRYQDESGQTYLLELDGWSWARYTDNVLRFGRPGDRIVAGEQIDSLMLAPSGSPLSWNSFLFYFCAWGYKLLLLFNKSIPLLRFLFYIPVFFAIIFIITLYMFCFYRWGNLGAVIACLFVGLSPIFLSRSCAGWFDTDILNLLFPLLILWVYLKAYAAVYLKARIFCLVFSAFCLGLFSFTWGYWWFIFLLIFVYELYFSATLFLPLHRYKQANLTLAKQHLFSFGLFTVSGLLGVVLFSGVGPLKYLYFQIEQALNLNNPLMISVWPNVYYTVAELGKPNLAGLNGYIGGPVLSVSSFAFLVMLFLRTRHKSGNFSFQRECITILTFWFLAMLFACFKGTRFIIFLLLPLGVSLGWVISEAYHFFKKKNMAVTVFVMLVFLSILAQSCLTNAYNAAEHAFPLMTDTWHNLLVKIKNQTPANAVINSWWDYGDWYKAVSGRRVIFDGQSQNEPQAYWMANVFISGNEEEALAILRMLNNGGNKAFNIINQRLLDPFKSLLLLKKILLSKCEEAKVTLLEFLPPGEADNVLRLLFDKPQAAYLIVDYTMLNKMGAISFLGNWDATKAYLAQGILKKEEKPKAIDYLLKLGLDKQKLQRRYEEAGLIPPKNLNNWISRRTIFRGGLFRGIRVNDNLVVFNKNMIYNPKDNSVYLYSSEAGNYKMPKSVSVFSKGKLERFNYPDNDLDVAALIFKEPDSYRAILLDSQLTDSMFVRLYFFGGSGLKYFKPFSEVNDGEKYIRVFEINWSADE